MYIESESIYGNVFFCHASFNFSIYLCIRSVCCEIYVALCKFALNSNGKMQAYVETTIVSLSVSKYITSFHYSRSFDMRRDYFVLVVTVFMVARFLLFIPSPRVRLTRCTIVVLVGQMQLMSFVVSHTLPSHTHTLKKELNATEKW